MTTDDRPAWRDLRAYPPASPGWYWAWDGDRGHAPVAMHYTGPGWLYVGRLGGDLAQVSWQYPWYWPAAIDVPPTAKEPE